VVGASDDGAFDGTLENTFVGLVVVGSADGGAVGLNDVGLGVGDFEGSTVVGASDDGVCDGALEFSFVGLIVVGLLDGGTVGLDVVGLGVGDFEG